MANLIFKYAKLNISNVAKLVNTANLKLPTWQKLLAQQIIKFPT